MLVGITLGLDDGQKARIRFAETAEGGAHVVCEASRGCVHDPPRFRRDLRPCSLARVRACFRWFNNVPNGTS